MSMRHLLPLTCLWFAAIAVAQPSATWLNARDLGASGSAFETRATTTSGSAQVTVADVGDFQVGQDVTISRCNVQYLKPTLRGPGRPYSTAKPLEQALEIRGYDGSAGSWMVYLIEVDGESPATFRWTDDLARTWKGTKVPITHDWQALSSGIEIKFARQEWKLAHMVSFTARDQLASTIQKIEGKTLTLAHPANRSVTDGIVRHNDTAALQAALDRAIKEKRNLFIPCGYYRLTSALRASAGNLTIQGESAPETTLDLSDGEGACIGLYGGTDITVRNLSLLGHTGFAEAAGSFRLSNGTDSFWACALKSGSAITIVGTERVLIENCHARRMASEAFYCQGPPRTSENEPKQHTKALTFLRCSVTDCAANAFNNNDVSENTSVLYCRIDGANWHAYEGPARFIRLEGNYIRNAGPFTIGDMSHRLEDLHKLGCGQAIVRNNVFEGFGRCGGITVNHGSGQVVIADNLFINYNGPAIDASSYTVRTSYPAKNITITGNLIDMTYVPAPPLEASATAGVYPTAAAGGADGKPQSLYHKQPTWCTAINVTASGTVVANNHIYTRGQTDPRITAIRIGEQAQDVTVHDNLIENCGHGIKTTRAGSTVTEVLDNKTFLEHGLPLEWRNYHRYRGWQVAWLNGAQVTGQSVIEDFDAEKLTFTLKEPRELKVGDKFEVFPPDGSRWSIHHNTVTGCSVPVLLDSYGGATSLFTDNIITRGAASTVRQALDLRGLFRLAGNSLSGFNEPDAVGLNLQPDRLARPYPPGFFRDNLITDCTIPVSEATKGLWEAAAAR